MKSVVALLAVLTLTGIWWGSREAAHEPEIALVLGEHWSEMRQRSSAVIKPALVKETWFGMPKTDAQLRFVDPQYGFVTPLARFFTIGYSNERITDIRMSPQVEPLLLDDALKVVLNLQNQWRKKGWYLTSPESDPAIADTVEWRTRLRDENKGGTTYWQAGQRYQILLDIGRYEDMNRPDEERYLITLSIAKPWIPADDELPSKHSEIILGEPPQ